MSYLYLVWSNLKRKKLRSLLTLLSIVVTFVLFGYLSAIKQALNREHGKTIIMVTHDPHASAYRRCILSVRLYGMKAAEEELQQAILKI